MDTDGAKDNLKLDRFVLEFQAGRTYQLGGKHCEILWIGMNHVRGHEHLYEVAVFGRQGIEREELGHIV